MWAEVGGAAVYYEEYGQGMPLLCLHGFPEDHGVMAGCVEPNKAGLQGYRRIYPDLPGMGRSPASPHIHNADDMLRLLRAFAAVVVGGQGYLLLGQSYGGYLALGMACKYPGDIEGLFLLCPCVVADRSRRSLPHKTAVPRAINLLPEDNWEDFEEFLEYTAVANNETWSRYKAEVLPGLRMADQDFVRRYQGEGYGFSFEGDFGDIHFVKPTCFLTAAQDSCVGYEDTYGLYKNFARATFTVVEGAGHNLQIEQPAYFDFYLCEWLKTVKGR